MRADFKATRECPNCKRPLVKDYPTDVVQCKCGWYWK